MNIIETLLTPYEANGLNPVYSDSNKVPNIGSSL